MPKYPRVPNTEYLGKSADGIPRFSFNMDGLKGPFPPDLVVSTYDAAVLREKCERYGVEIVEFETDHERDNEPTYTIKMAGGVVTNIHGHREEVDCFLYGVEAWEKARRYMPDQEA